MIMQAIKSIKDPLIVAARSLNKAQNRTQNYLIEGNQPITWALDAGVELMHVFSNNQESEKTLISTLVAQNIPCYQCSDGIMKKINDSKFLTPTIAVAKIRQSTTVQSNRFILMMESIQDQGNLGTIIRTASALGIKKIITTEKGADIYNKKTITASRGTCFSINHNHIDSSLKAIQSLKNQGYQIVATTPRGEQLQSTLELKTKPIVLIVGNETNGISQTVFDKADYRIQIPMSSAVESLNVGVAAGISMYELNIKGTLIMLTDLIRQTLGREVGVTHSLLQEQLDLVLQEQCNIRGAQARLLMIMACGHRLSQHQIEKDLACHGEELEQLLTPLLERELIMKSDDTYFDITPEGESHLAKIWTVIEKVEAKATSDFTNDEINLFKEFIRRIQSNCKTE